MDRLKAIYNTYSNLARTDASGAYDEDNKLISLDESAISTEMDRLKAEAEANVYAERRRKEYPDWGTQLNKIYDDGVTKWKSEMVDPVKAKWPKDNSGPK